MLCALTIYACASLVAVDGDTVRYQGINVGRMRLERIDTPEIFSPKCPQERDLGKRAQVELQVILDRGVEVIDSGRRDKYKNKLVSLRTRDGRDVADLMIARGLGRAYTGGRKGSWCP